MGWINAGTGGSRVEEKAFDDTDLKQFEADLAASGLTKAQNSALHGLQTWVTQGCPNAFVVNAQGDWAFVDILLHLKEEDSQATLDLVIYVIA